MHGLPMGQKTKLKAGWVANRVGKVLEVDFRSQRIVWVTQFIRVKVLINVSKPLSPRFLCLERFGRMHGCNSNLKGSSGSVLIVGV